MGAKKKPSLKSLSSGRPPMAQSSRSMSRKTSRKLINKHHQLEKQRRQAAEKGDRASEAKIAEELSNLGGLDHYQKASLQGQSNDRGGDTSKVLLQWLPVQELRGKGRVLRMLEVGSLSTRNACSTSGVFEMVHIDLNSQEQGIQQQDFMERPLPTDDSERFDMISLSLVLNFVPEPALRGQMLLRTLSFLRSPPPLREGDRSESTPAFLPSLFLVLPRSCVDNSRYFTDARLAELMGMLGYTRLQAKVTQKLAYSLWVWRSSSSSSSSEGPPRNAVLVKKELNPGRVRNNFVVTLKTDSSGKAV